MREPVLALGATCAMLIQACTNEPDVHLALTVASTEPQVVAETHRVLLSRFDEFRPSLFSSIVSRIDESTITFKFKNGTPDRRNLEYLYQTPGRFRASLAEDSIASAWFTDQDIANAALGHETSDPVLFIRLTPMAGERVVRLTSQNLG